MLPGRTDSVRRAASPSVGAPSPPFKVGFDDELSHFEWVLVDFVLTSKLSILVELWRVLGVVLRILQVF